MSLIANPLSPSSSLPPLGGLNTGNLTETGILAALRNLSILYCPLSACACPLPARGSRTSSTRASDNFTDSGYTSETEDDNNDHAKELELKIATIRADPFERNQAERWLTGFISRADSLPCLDREDARQAAIDQAACVLQSLMTGGDDEVQLCQDQSNFAHDFSFDLPSDPTGERAAIKVRLHDRIAGTDTDDHNDVGLQLWGGSILFSELLCSSPARFGLDMASLGLSPRIIELGAGAGLVSLVLGTLLPRLGIARPRIVATDYHPAVLENLRSNVTHGDLPVETSLLDWSDPVLHPPLDVPADLLFATDVVYAPEHAVLLRDCAARLLAREGVFWLFTTIRENGRFEGISSTVEAAFAGHQPVNGDGKRLALLGSERLGKQRGIGRGDESGYDLFKIGWI